MIANKNGTNQQNSREIPKHMQTDGKHRRVTPAPKKRNKKGKKGKSPIFLTLFAIFLCALIAGGIWMRNALKTGLDIEPEEKPPVVDSLDITKPDISGEEDETGPYQRKEGFYTFLVVGSDKVGSNTDTILLVGFDTEADTLNILQIPRDTQLDVKRNVKKVNASYAYNGIDGLKSDLSDFLGIPIDRYGIINTNSFCQVVDAVGGVTVTVPSPGMQYFDEDQGLSINLAPGTQTLTGKEAEGFVRYRSGYADADLGRLKAQKAFLSSMIEKLLTPSMILKAPQFAEIAYNNLKTDMGLSDMIYVANQAIGVAPENIRFFSLPGEGVGANYGAYPEETMAMINQSFNPYTEDIPEEDFKFYSFTRELTNTVDISGTPLAEAVDTKLSSIIQSQSTVGDGKTNEEKPPEETGEPEQLPETNEEQDPTGSEGENTSNPENTGENAPVEEETPSAVGVEIINASGEASILANYIDMFTQDGYTVVKTQENSDLLYEITAIINKNEREAGKKMFVYFPTADYFNSYQDGYSADVIIILGQDLIGQ